MVSKFCHLSGNYEIPSQKTSCAIFWSKFEANFQFYWKDEARVVPNNTEHVGTCNNQEQWCTVIAEHEYNILFHRVKIIPYFCDVKLTGFVWRDSSTCLSHILLFSVLIYGWKQLDDVGIAPLRGGCKYLTAGRAQRPINISWWISLNSKNKCSSLKLMFILLRIISGAMRSLISLPTIVKDQILVSDHYLMWKPYCVWFWTSSAGEIICLSTLFGCHRPQQARLPLLNCTFNLQLY